MGGLSMNCMKCGREIEEDQAFCSYCLLDMEQHPVKPGTVILLPSQDKPAGKKAVKKKKPTPTPEEQVENLKKKLLIHRIGAAVLAVAVCGLIYLSGRVILELDIQRLLGQNYSSATDAEETEPFWFSVFD